jgi:hypothetical protein
MRFRAIFIPEDNHQVIKAKQIFANSIESIKEWADVILAKSKGTKDCVMVYETFEKFHAKIDPPTKEESTDTQKV